ncbi:hypothetical protein QTL95_23655 [Rhizobium sp. S152]|uniref:hypothetical protein n=1 Tax=Rhizobium sp. S152 TaxID=3055038 RepID=UPI0025A946B9|nr:hypothetical protein [Rhizobium sp. S152]MDM9628898.1 hypothetical protein [Rhizobium sp. S152]
MGLTIVSEVPFETGWSPISHMQQLLADLTDSKIEDVSQSKSNRLKSLYYRYAPRPYSTDDRVALFITTSAMEARKFVPVAKALGGFSRTAIWIIDSFWTDAAVQERKLIDRHFDIVAYMQSYDDELYRKLFGDRALRLEWGSDALNLGTAGADREVDLLRMGRQPADWEDDDVTMQDCANRGIRFRGRPPLLSKVDDFPELMRAHYSRTKYVLANSNIAAPAPYTHPTKAYMTGRWTDALACGATVAGIPPEGDIALLDWPEALLRFRNLDRRDGLDQLQSALADWTPAVAARNHLGALRQLDWRWRFAKLLNALDVKSPRLDKEMQALRDRIQQVETLPYGNVGQT